MFAQIHKFRVPIVDTAVGTAANSNACKALLALVCVFFLAAQTVGLSHSHENDLSAQADCEVCLKLSTDDEALASSATSAFKASFSSEPSSIQPAWASKIAITAHARAPPLA